LGIPINNTKTNHEQLQEINALVHRFIAEAEELQKCINPFDDHSVDVNYIRSIAKAEAIQYCVLQLCKILLKE